MPQPEMQPQPAPAPVTVIQPSPPSVRPQPEMQPALAPFPCLLILGGCRSGKSRLALNWALNQPAPRAFLATADPANDPSMESRIARHQAERGPQWHTFLTPLDPVSALQQAAKQCHVALFDCVTLWLSNLMFAQAHEPNDKTAQSVLSQVRQLAALLAEPPLPLVLVSNEVGQGVAPSTSLGCLFRDIHGEANQILAAAAPNVVLSHAGLPLLLKGQY